MSGEGQFIKNLGYYLNSQLQWTRQGQHLQSAVGAAALDMRMAATAPACHLSTVAMLTQHDVTSRMEYSFMAMGTTPELLRNVRTTQVEPLRQRAGLCRSATPRALLCGALPLGGTGLIDPIALNAGVKASTLLTTLNSPGGHAMRALYHTYASAHPADRPGATRRKGKQPEWQAYACPTITEGLAAITSPPGSEPAWRVVAQRPSGAITLGELMSQYLPPALSCKQRNTLKQLLALRLDQSVEIAQEGGLSHLSPLDLALLNDRPPLALSNLLSAQPETLQRVSHARTQPARQAAPGRRQALPTAPELKLTPAAARHLNALTAALKRETLQAIVHGLTALATSPHAPAHTAHLTALHAARHDPVLGPSTAESSNITDVGVDGSFAPATGLAAAGVAYLVRHADCSKEIHITNCTYEGTQSPGDAEITAIALCLRLAALHDSPAFKVGWDCLAPLRHVLHTVPATYSQPTPAQAAAELAGRSPPSATPQHHPGLSHDAQMARITALLACRQAAGHTTTLIHQKAHTSDDSLRALWPTELCTAATPGVHIIRGATLDALFAATAQQHDQDVQGEWTAAHTHLLLNACADWAAKQVTLAGKPACHHLGHSTWPPAAYAVATLGGAYINSGPNALRRQVIERTERGTQADYINSNARKQAKYSLRTESHWQSLWAAESTSALRMPCLYPERAATLYLRCMTGTMAYNGDRAADCPALLTVRTHKDGPTMSTTCPLCMQAGLSQPGQDTTHHIFNTCPATAAKRTSLRASLAAALAQASHDRIPTADATAIAEEALSRQDYFAGQISIRTQQLLEASRAHTPWLDTKGRPLAYVSGTLHRHILSWAASVHAERAALVSSTGRNHTPPGPYARTHDANAFQKALWNLKKKHPAPTGPAQPTTTHQHCNTVTVHSIAADTAPPTSQQAQQTARITAWPPSLAIPVQLTSPAQGRPTQRSWEPIQAHQTLPPTTDLTVNLADICAAWGLAEGTTPGDGDCAFHSARGLAPTALGRRALTAANRAAQALRTKVVQHAKEQSTAYRTAAGTITWQEADWAQHLSAARYNPTTGRLSSSSTYLPPELLPSLAATIRKDIVVLTRNSATGRIQPKPVLYPSTPPPNRRGRPIVCSLTDLETITLRFRATDPAHPTPSRPRVVIFDGNYDTARSTWFGHYTALVLPHTQLRAINHPPLEPIHPSRAPPAAAPPLEPILSPYADTNFAASTSTPGYVGF